MESNGEHWINSIKSWFQGHNERKDDDLFYLNLYGNERKEMCRWNKNLLKIGNSEEGGGGAKKIIKVGVKLKKTLRFRQKHVEEAKYLCIYSDVISTTNDLRFFTSQRIQLRTKGAAQRSVW